VLLGVAEERIVLLSTHLAGDVEATATRLLVLGGGRLRYDGPPAELVRQARGRVFAAVLDDGEMREFARRYRVTARVRTLAGIARDAGGNVEKAAAGDAPRKS